MAEKREKRSGRKLRCGFTTGSAAAAGAKAGTIFLLTGAGPERMDIPLPPGGRLSAPIHGYEPGPDSVTVSVVKDAGDDPDVTHGHVIQAMVELVSGDGPDQVEIVGGKGVGVVTLPGLPVPVGEPAINPEPRRQIREAVLEGCAQGGYSGRVRATISIPKGEELAQRTMNPRLGIVGGLSVLGVRGTVKPFSHEAYMAAISEGLDVARAAGLKTAALSTGGRSERMLKQLRPELRPLCFIQIADFMASSLEAAAKRGFERIILGCFFGKLVKLGQGLRYTHADSGRIDFPGLAGVCARAGVSAAICAAVSTANTARQTLAAIEPDPAGKAGLELIGNKGLAKAREWTGPGPDLELFLFDFDGRVLLELSSPGSREKQK